VCAERDGVGDEDQQDERGMTAARGKTERQGRAAGRSRRGVPGDGIAAEQHPRENERGREAAEGELRGEHARRLEHRSRGDGGGGRETPTLREKIRAERRQMSRRVRKRS